MSQFSALAAALVVGSAIVFFGTAAKADQIYLHCVVSGGMEIVGNQVNIRVDSTRSTATVMAGAADSRGNTLRARITPDVIAIPYVTQGGFGWRINRMTGNFEFNPGGERTFFGRCATINRPKF